MTDAFRVEVEGLRDALGRFAREASTGLRARQDQMLIDLATGLRQRLQETAPRGRSVPHLADMFTTSALQREGPNASISVANTKQVHSKSGRTWSLINLITQGTRPHEIHGAPWLHFEVGGQEVFTQLVHHPGTSPNPFAQRAVEHLDMRAKLLTMARGVIADLSGGSRGA